MRKQYQGVAISLTVFLLPLIVIKAFAFLSGGGSPQAAIAVPPTPIHIPTPMPTNWTEGQLDAARRIKELELRSFGVSPLLHIRSGDIDPIDTHIGLQPHLAPPPNVKVDVIWSSSNVNLALIGGKTYREGDLIKDTEWVVTEIDIRERAVTIEHPDSERVEVIPIDRNR